jgi:hypothetical protein
MRRLFRPLWFTLAVIFLVEAWLWDHLKPIVRWIVERIAWRELRVWIVAAIERLPPYATLLVFLIPVAVLLPFKLLGLWLLAKGSWLGAVAILGLAKLVGVGISAFIFEVTRPKLLQLAWFRWLYEHVLTWLAWAHALVDPYKAKIIATLASVRLRLKIWRRLFGPRRAGRTLKMMWRLRRRVQGPPRPS